MEYLSCNPADLEFKEEITLKQIEQHENWCATYRNPNSSIRRHASLEQLYQNLMHNLLTGAIGNNNWNVVILCIQSLQVDIEKRPKENLR